MTTKRALAAAAVAPHLEKRGPDAVLSCPVLIIQVVVCAVQVLPRLAGKGKEGKEDCRRNKISQFFVNSLNSIPF
jgi:hypothetical protein